MWRGEANAFDAVDRVDSAQQVGEFGPVLARAEVAAYLARSGRAPGLRWRVTTTADSVRVEMSAPLDLPLVPPGWSGRTTVASEAGAVSVVG